MSRTFAILTIVMFVVALAAAALGFGPFHGPAIDAARIAFAVAVGLMLLIAALGILTGSNGGTTHLGGGKGS